MKQIYFSIILIIVVILPQALVGQQRPAELPQTQSVTFMVKDGDSVVPKSVDVTYSPKQEQDKQAAPPYDQAPEAKKMVQPKYPEAATRAGTEGTVWTKVFIDDKGKVTKVTISKSDAEIFNQPSIDAAMQWVFKPALKDGKPLAVEVAIPFRFKLQKGGEVTDYTEPSLGPLSVLVSPHHGYRVTRQHPYLIGQSYTATNEWYPEKASEDRAEGMVVLKLTVNVGGRVERVEVADHARADLDSAAVQLARTWTFIPGQSNGMPEKSIIRVPVFFFPGRPPK